MHSPAPWRAEPTGTGRNKSFVNGARIVGADEVQIAWITRKADKPFDRKQADLDLICRAPTLLRVAEAATDLVSLWETQKILGVSRAERNATIESVRNRLIEAVHEAKLYPPEASAGENDDPEQGEIHRATSL